MTGATHQAGALLTAGLYAQTLGLSPALTVATAIGAFITARLPDVDAARDPEGPRRYDHRRLPHSLVFAGGGVLLAALLAVATLGYPPADLAYDQPLPSALSTLYEADPKGLVAVVTVGGALGYLSHLLFDAFTTKGIWLMQPGGRRLVVPLVTKGRLPEPLVLVGITLALVPTLVTPVLFSVIPW